MLPREIEVGRGHRHSARVGKDNAVKDTSTENAVPDTALNGAIRHRVCV